MVSKITSSRGLRRRRGSETGVFDLGARDQGRKTALGQPGAAVLVKSRISAKRVLVVEDEYLVAMDMSAYLEAAGAHVVGPASNVHAALEVVQHTELDGAILDVNLRGELAYPIADALAARGIPFVFTTGYDSRAVPARFAGIKHCEKPATPEAISRALFG